MVQDKILFFASGDFAIPTFKALIQHNYNITGLVTSKDKLMFPERSDNKRLIDIAVENNIPVLIVNNSLNDPDTYKWIVEKEADIYCVISFKFLPDIILKSAKKVAFNIHGSLLPYFRGAAPIQHALRCGFEETGLTAFVLNDKIDTGNIIETTKIKIEPEDNFKTLFCRMSDKCTDLTIFVIEKIALYGEDYYINDAKQQPNLNLPDDYATAPKLRDDFSTLWTSLNKNEAVNHLRALSPLNGLKMTLILTDKKSNKTKEMTITVFSADFHRKYIDKPLLDTDLKTYLHFSPDNVDWFCNITELQVSGKKKMTVSEFLPGFVNIYKNNNIVLK